MNYTPIAIFGYKRPNQFENLLNTLSENPEAKYSDVYIFIDRAKNDQDLVSNLEVLKISKKNWKFKSKIIVYRNEHFGLRKNIVKGIDFIFENFEQIIVLEEDLTLSSTFLNYMNKSLEKYKNNKRIWHISGYNLNLFLNFKNSSHFSTQMNCWGWATWKNRWDKFDKEFKLKINLQDKKIVNKFNFDGYDKSNTIQLLRNEEKKIETWAIFWYQEIFQNNGLCLNPNKSLVKNNGFDGSGENKSKSNFYNVKNLNQNFIKFFPLKLKINNYIIFQIKIKFMIYNLKDFTDYHLKKLLVK